MITKAKKEGRYLLKASLAFLNGNEVIFSWNTLRGKGAFYNTSRGILYDNCRNTFDNWKKCAKCCIANSKVSQISTQELFEQKNENC